MFRIALFGVMVLTFAMPWVKVADEFFCPGQFIIPFTKHALRKVGVLKTDEMSAPSLEDLFVYEPSLRFLGTPSNEGGPKNQITFELMGYAMFTSLIMLLIPLKTVNIFGCLISLGSSSGFCFAMIALEGKTVQELGVGLWGNISASFVSMIVRMFT